MIPKQSLELIFMFHSVKLIAHQNSDNEPGSEHILVKTLCDLFTFTSSLASNKKKFKLVELFFQSANEVKTCGTVQQLILHMLRDLILQQCDSHSLNGDPP